MTVATSQRLTEVTPEILARAKKIKVMVFDVDGVLTNGGLMLGDDGLEYKTFHSHDGLGMKMLKASGVQMAIISGRTSNVVTKRAENTGIEHVYHGVHDKFSAFDNLAKKLGLSHDELGFMGDDVIDIGPMRRAGLAVAVPTAWAPVFDYAHYVTKHQAGFGAVREVCELIMQSQGTLATQYAPFLK